jgi:hypothetical protein
MRLGIGSAGELHHVLRDQEHVVLEQRGLHFAALAGEVALAQRGHCADGAEHAAHDVVHAGARAQRVARAARHVGEAAHHLHHFVERGAVVVRAGQKALVAHVDEARIQLAERVVVEPQLLHGAGLEVLADDVGGGDEAQRGLHALGLLQVERDALLVAVEGREEARARAEQAARVVALDGLDLDDLGAEVGQQQAAGRTHDHVGELDDADAGIRKRIGFRHVVRCVPGRSPWAIRLPASCRRPARPAGRP